MTVKSYKDLHVWQRSITLADAIYTVTESFPKNEQFGLSQQLRRAAVSVASNIAEGSVRGSKEFVHFINIARGSLAEVETQLVIVEMRRYLSRDKYETLVTEMNQTSRMLMALLKSVKEHTRHQALQAQGTI